MKCNRFVIFTLSLCFAAFAQGREVYKCVSADGRISYMDKPCDKNAKSVTEVIIKDDTPSAAEASKQQADWKKKSDEFNERYQGRLSKEQDDAFWAAKKKASEQAEAARAKQIADEQDRLQREAGARAAARRANGY